MRPDYGPLRKLLWALVRGLQNAHAQGALSPDQTWSNSVSPARDQGHSRESEISHMSVPGIGAHSPGVDYVFNATNDYRTANGVSALAFDASSQSVAQAWAEQMAADYAGGMTLQEAFRHNPNMSAQIPSGWHGAAENIALNKCVPGSIREVDGPVEEELGAQRQHADPNWTAVGVGVYTDSSGITWGVQVFAEYPAVTTLTLSGPSTLATGGMAHFTVAVAPKVSGSLGLQHQVAGGQWVTSSMTVPVVNGVASFALAPKVTVSYRVMFGGVTSNAVKVVQAGAA